MLPNEKSAGFVICYIPESDSKPHRSEFGKGDVKRFNLRIGDTTQECTVPLLRQLFYPKYSPKLSITLELRSPGEARSVALIINPTRKAHLIRMSLLNEGAVSVFDIAARIRCGKHTVYKDGISHALSQFGTEQLAGTLHPGLDFTVDLLVFPENISTACDWEVTVFARDILPKRAVISFASLFQNFEQKQTADCI